MLSNEDCSQDNGSIQQIGISSNADTLTYFWNGVVSDSLNLYDLSEGSYQLIVIDNNNCSNTLNLNIVDTNYHQIDIGYSALVLEADEPIDFYETSTDSSTVWFWTFGDDSTSVLNEPTHTYSYAGIYTICLVASNQYGCSDTACVDIELEPAKLLFPIFTPNGDLVNDKFEFKELMIGLELEFLTGGAIYYLKKNLTSTNGMELTTTVHY